MRRAGAPANPAGALACAGQQTHARLVADVAAMIRTPDQRLRVFVSSTLGELADERAAVRRAIERLRLSPVMFELGARPHPPRELYRAYLAQSHLFIGVYWQRYGWIAPGETISGLEDEYRLAARLPQLMYIKEPAPNREDELTALLQDVQEADRTSYRRFRTLDELEELVSQDLAVLLSERFERAAGHPAGEPRRAPVPLPLTPTIGRDDEIDDLVARIDAGARLVTVTGPGGVGKTRLALEAAGRLAERGGMDVHYVPLDAVTSASLVMTTIADQLGIRDAAGRSAADAVVDHVGASHVLLVLDNLEQVVAAAPEIGRLLERAPGLQVLATSRQALRIRGEHEYTVTPLATPPHADEEVDDVAAVPAVRLLVERARSFGGRFALTEHNAPAVAELSRRLEGLPLAIELAAARLRLLSPSTLLERLDTTLDLLATGADVPARQRTLRATLDWSHALLSDHERALFARCAVFAGGATVQAIEAVCGDDTGDVLESLAGLLDKNLVAVDDATLGDEPRFRMLAPVRSYAWERLEAGAETAAVRRRHLDYFCNLGRRAQPFLCGPNQREWAARLDAERANLRAAIAAGSDLDALGEILRLIWDTLVYYYIREAIEEPRDWLRALLPRRTDFDESQQALLDVGLVIVGDPPEDRDVVDLLVAAGTVFDARGLALEGAVALHYLGLQHWREGDAGAAVAALTSSSQRYAALAHDWGVATVEMTLGAVRAATGAPESATAHLRRSLRHSRRIDNRPQIAQALQGLALVDARLGDDDRARDALVEAVGIVVADRSVTGATYCLEARAAVAIAEDDVQGAVKMIGAARSTRERLRIPEWTAAADAATPVLAQARDALEPAHFATAWAQGAAADVFDLLEHATAGPGES